MAAAVLLLVLYLGFKDGPQKLLDMALGPAAGPTADSPEMAANAPAQAPLIPESARLGSAPPEAVADPTPAETALVEAPAAATELPEAAAMERTLTTPEPEVAASPVTPEIASETTATAVVMEPATEAPVVTTGTVDAATPQPAVDEEATLEVEPVSASGLPFWLLPVVAVLAVLLMLGAGAILLRGRQGRPAAAIAGRDPWAKLAQEVCTAA